MFGAGLSVPVPDVDRTDHLLILGANPLVSNGSLLTAPDMRGRIRAIRERGGKVVVIDPRRSRTAARGLRAPLHPPRHRRAAAVRDRQRAARRGPRRTRAALAEHANGAERIARARRAVHPRGGRARVRDRRRRDPPDGARARRRRARRRLRADRDHDAALRHARELARRRPQLPHRQPRPRGRGDVPARRRRRSATRPAPARSARASRIGRWASRVSGRPEVFGELPVVGLAEEITTPGEGQVRALVTIAGNPLVSTPDAGRARRTRSRRSTSWSRSTSTSTRRPATPTSSSPPPSRWRRPTTTPRSTSSPSAASPTTRRRSCRAPPSQPDEWEMMLRLAAIAAGQGPDADIEAWDELVVRTADRPRGRARRARRSRAATPTRSSPRSAIAAAPSACSTSCSASVRSATASAPTPTG